MSASDQQTFASNKLLNVSENFDWTLFGTHLVRYYSVFLLHTFGALEHFLLFFAAYGIVCLLVYLIITWSWSLRWQRVRFSTFKRVLFVIAHPDDESMFFGPTIRSLTQRKNCQVYLLCLSNGKKFSLVVRKKR